jgi:hypothetical protein
MQIRLLFVRKKEVNSLKSSFDFRGEFDKNYENCIQNMIYIEAFFSNNDHVVFFSSYLCTTIQCMVVNHLTWKFTQLKFGCICRVNRLNFR